MSKQLKIFFVPMELVGHTMSMFGLAQTLVDRGHHVTFVVDESRRKLLIDNEKINVCIVENTFSESKYLGEFESLTFNKLTSSVQYTFTWIKDMIRTYKSYPISMHKRMVTKNIQLKSIIEEHDPDIFIIDDLFGYQAIFETNKPWVWLESSNPLTLMDDASLPVPLMGQKSGEHSGWKQWLARAYFIYTYKGIRLYFNTILRMINSPISCLTKRSPYLNIYGFPQEMDYSYKKVFDFPLFRIDSFMTKDTNKRDLSEDLLKFIDDNRGKKLVYISLGSYCSANIEFMKNLVEILSKSPNLFIVSKGFYHDKYELANNMWGEYFLPQKQIIEIVDLVITHGGNNTITEAFSLGKPMIVFPFLVDQFDNAQRIHETGYGIRINPNTYTEHDLLDAIENLLNDEELKQKLNKASKRIWAENRLEQAAELIEKLYKE